MKSRMLAAAAVVIAMAAPVAASAQSSYSTFENVPGGPGPNSFTTVSEADGWTGGPLGIELQNNVAGSPATLPVGNGGSVFVELDTTADSYMFRTLTAGLYDLSYLYSPRPGVDFTSNPIVVSLGNKVLSFTTNQGGSNTSWYQVNVARFQVVGTQELRFSATTLPAGSGDSLGGYVDNINISAVPEPATWALMILGFGAVGGAMRRRRSAGSLATA